MNLINYTVEFSISNKGRTGVLGAGSSLAGGIIGGVVSNYQAKKKAKELGLEEDSYEYLKFIRLATTKGVGIGIAIGAVTGVGTGLLLGKYRPLKSGSSRVHKKRVPTQIQEYNALCNDQYEKKQAYDSAARSGQYTREQLEHLKQEMTDADRRWKSHPLYKGTKVPHTPSNPIYREETQSKIKSQIDKWNERYKKK